MIRLFALLWLCTGSALQADEPKVLIIGDSISLGYTPHVVQLMKDRAVVKHNPGNAQHTGTGLQKIDNWLGDTDWDVIHFNWGLWDLCYRHPESKNQGRRDKERGSLTTSIEDFEANLEKLVVRLKRTNATLIWGNITVIPEGEAGRKIGDDLRYNEVAARVMTKYGITTNDLNRLSRTIPADLFTKPGDVHFKPDGYRMLAAQVVATIDQALNNKAVTQPITRVLFGSCIRQENPVPIFDAILQDDPELFVFLGDNIYGDTEDMGLLKAKYAALGAKPGFQKLRKRCDVIATWDDHDYGVNDGGADYPQREASQAAFNEFWYGKETPPSADHPGVYNAHVYGPAGRRIQVILLDTRYFRSPLKRGEKRVGGPWLPDPDPAKTMLGDTQWKWLEAQLQVPAELRIIASSIQFLAEDAGQETWSNLPAERQRMLTLLADTKATGVVFISGDRHWSELSALGTEIGYPLFDLTSSSLNQAHGRGTPTTNKHRFALKTYHEVNYGVISVNWDDDPEISLQIKDLEGNVQIQHDTTLSRLAKQ